MMGAWSAATAHDSTNGLSLTMTHGRQVVREAALTAAEGEAVDATAGAAVARGDTCSPSLATRRAMDSMPVSIDTSLALMSARNEAGTFDRKVLLRYS